VYGYRDLIVTGNTRWSAIITDAKPSASPVVTSDSSVSAVAV
jgi:hypothetical protein